jgi:CheY-like chemotaxis protein
LPFDTVKVLVVDDNDHMRILLVEILRAVGVRHIFQASDGMKALQLLRRETVDLVTTDLAMRPMDGVEFVRLLRTMDDSPAPYCPVLMISGHTTLKRIFEARDAGVTEFLSKPVTVRGMLGRIEQIINHPRPFVRSGDYFGPDRRRHNKPGYEGPWRRAGDRLAQVLD